MRDTLSRALDDIGKNRGPYGRMDGVADVWRRLLLALAVVCSRHVIPGSKSLGLGRVGYRIHPAWWPSRGVTRRRGFQGVGWFIESTVSKPSSPET